MTRDLRRYTTLTLRWIAAAICVVLLVEQFRSFFRSDTVCLFPLAIVTDRGDLYIATDFTDDFVVASEPVEDGSVPWIVQRASVQAKSKVLDDAFLGIGGFFGDHFTLIKLPIVFAFAVPALYLAWSFSGYDRRTHYLACPSCGYGLAAVVYTRCPECGSPVASRVVVALPRSAIRPPWRLRSAATGSHVSV